jgi:hypothetical protein
MLLKSVANQVPPTQGFGPRLTPHRMAGIKHRHVDIPRDFGDAVPNHCFGLVETPVSHQAFRRDRVTISLARKIMT